MFPTDNEIAEMDRVHSERKIIVQNHYYPIPGKFDEVLSLRISASNLLRKFGLTGGRVMVARQMMDRAKGNQEEVAAIIWQAEYRSLGALKTELNLIQSCSKHSFKWKSLIR